METLDPAILDPGIRDLVMALRDAGWNTTDSGDGYSKPQSWYDDGDAQPFKHVYIAGGCHPMFMVDNADLLFGWLAANYPSFYVEASYQPHTGSVVLMVLEHA